jgi:hypothetical protein
MDPPLPSDTPRCDIAIEHFGAKGRAQGEIERLAGGSGIAFQRHTFLPLGGSLA